jgi:hypothetical protein
LGCGEIGGISRVGPGGPGVGRFRGHGEEGDREGRGGSASSGVGRASECRRCRGSEGRVRQSRVRDWPCHLSCRAHPNPLCEQMMMSLPAPARFPHPTERPPVKPKPTPPRMSMCRHVFPPSPAASLKSDIHTLEQNLQIQPPGIITTYRVINYNKL